METLISPALKPWIGYSRLNPRASLRFFCFPYSGGSASAYRSWENGLPTEIELISIQLPGRENRMYEKPFTHLTPLLEALLDVLPPLLDKPFVLFGHSLGALIGFELARQLRKHGESLPQHLFISAHRAPQRPLLQAPLHLLPDTDMLQELRNLKGTPETVLQNKELMDMLMPLLKADFSVYETYTYNSEEALSCDITAFCGKQDGRVLREEMASWREQTSKRFMLHSLPGEHFFIHTAQSQLLQLLSSELVEILNRIY